MSKMPRYEAIISPAINQLLSVLENLPIIFDGRSPLDRHAKRPGANKLGIVRMAWSESMATRVVL
jgi:hypothetical protein